MYEWKNHRHDMDAIGYEASTPENVTPKTWIILQFEALLNDLWHRDNYLKRSFWTHGNRRFSRGRSLAALGSEVSMFRYRFWFYRKDGKGRPLDEKIGKAAEEIAPTLARYREHEIRCESTIDEMMQSAVEAASKAKRSRPLENPIGYLTFIYKRIVDRSLNRTKRLVTVDDTFLEDLLNAHSGTSLEEQIHNRLLMEKLINCM